MKYVIVFCMLCCSGCTIFGRDTYYESRRPIIPVPERPTLKELPSEADLNALDAEGLRAAYDKAVNNMENLGNWGLQYEAVVAKYNEISKQKNIDNGYTIADPEPGVETPPAE